MSKFILVYITCPNKREASKIGKTLLQDRLAACINIFDSMQSMYWRKERIRADKEVVLIAKTTGILFSTLSKKVKSIHSYSVPCILKMEVKDGNQEYLDWLKSNLK